MVFQSPSGNTYSLAWFARYAYPGTTLGFDWDDSAYEFVWSANGQITPGILISASQTVPADFSNGNQIAFSYDVAHRTFNLHDRTAGAPTGNLIINADSTIPLNAVAVGIGMSGAPCFVVQGQPNITIMFQPRAEYWIAFGTYTQGEVLDIETITTPLKVEFPINVASLTATFNADMTWTVTSNILSERADEEA